MSSQSPHDTPAPRDSVGSADNGEEPGLAETGESDDQLSQFSQRLASFGLGEAPDPLLTEARTPGKRRSRR
jgi:hypothetical protein